MEPWVEFNRKYAEQWPVITRKKEPMPGYADMDGVAGKLEKYFSPNPGGAIEPLIHLQTARRPAEYALQSLEK